MIGQAVTEFRTLGLYSPPDTTDAATDHRTLVLAFRYVAGGNALATGAAGSIKEYELIFVHRLKEDDTSTPNVVVFSTSHGRTKFHELESATPDSLVQHPSIEATVRFDDFKFFGLYPTQPVVTGIMPRARLSLPVESVRARLLGLSGNDPLNLSELLDELHAESGETDTSVDATTVQ